MGSSFRTRRHGGSLEHEASADALAELYFDVSAESVQGHDTRAEQLSAQVADALTLAFADARDPLLRKLVVVGVVPRRGAACLQVTLEVAPSCPIGEIQRRVQRAVGWLRSEVADAIERKRVPDLVFVVRPEVTP